MRPQDGLWYVLKFGNPAYEEEKLTPNRGVDWPERAG